MTDLDALRARAMAEPRNAALQIEAADAALAADLKMDAVVFLTNAYRVERTRELYDRLRGLVDGHDFRMLRLPHPRASRPFAHEFAALFGYPLTHERLWLVVGGGLLVGAARLAPAIFYILAEPLYLTFLAACCSGLALQTMRVAAGGRDDCLDWAGDDMGGMALSMRAGGFLAVGITQLAVGAVIVGAYTGVNVLGSAFLLLILGVLGSLVLTPLWPAALLVWGVSGGSTLERINPIRWIRLAWAAPRDYAIVTLVFLAAGVGFVLCEAAARVLAWDSIALLLVVSPILAAVQVYLLLLAFRLTGLLWFHHEDRFAAIAERSVE